MRIHPLISIRPADRRPSPRVLWNKAEVVGERSPCGQNLAETKFADRLVKFEFISPALGRFDDEVDQAIFLKWRGLLLFERFFFTAA